jgi:hypothetical protein
MLYVVYKAIDYFKSGLYMRGSEAHPSITMIEFAATQVYIRLMYDLRLKACMYDAYQCIMSYESTG